jgi:hypothetical protein
MKVTSTIEFDLDKLKNCFLLKEDGTVLVLKAWKTEQVTTTGLFGKEKVSRYVTEFYMTSVDTLNTKYTHCYKADERRLDDLKSWRKGFIKMREQMDKFGYVIKGKGR